MRYVRIVIKFHLVVFALSVIQSCLCETNITISDQPGNMSAWELTPTNGRKLIDSVRGDFLLETSFVLTYSERTNNAMISAGYASSCKKIYHNKIDPLSFKLTLDKAFVFGTDTIKQGINILQLDSSGININSSGHYHVEYRFTKNFFSKATISKSAYLFRLEGMTDNGVKLKAEMPINIEL